MHHHRWRELLERYSAHLTGEEGAWLGRSPATPQEIEAAETRLGVRLSPVVRAFYEVSNGWGSLGSFVYGIRPVHELTWAREDELVVEIAEMSTAEADDYPDEAYAWGTRLLRAVLLSDAVDAGWWLLDPHEDPGGEWHAGRSHSWASEGVRWLPDLLALVESELERQIRLGAR